MESRSASEGLVGRKELAITPREEGACRRPGAEENHNLNYRLAVKLGIGCRAPGLKQGDQSGGGCTRHQQEMLGQVVQVEAVRRDGSLGHAEGSHRLS